MVPNHHFSSTYMYIINVIAQRAGMNLEYGINIYKLCPVSFPFYKVTLQSEFIYCMSSHHKQVMKFILGHNRPPHPYSHECISHQKAW